MAAPKPLVWQLLCLAVMVMLFYGILRPNDNQDSLTYDTDAEGNEHACSLDSAAAERLKLTEPISYARLQIDVVEPKWYHRKGNETEGRELNIALPTPRRLIDVNGNLVATEDETCANRTTLTMPKQSKRPVDASKIVFGVATNLERLEASLEAFAYWAGKTGARILSLVEAGSGDTGQMAKVLRDAEDLEIKLEIARQNLSAESTDGDRYFALIKHLHDQRGDEPVEWAVLIDDDTFFPSMQKLLNRLDQYDAFQPQYLGGLTEDLHQMQNWGYMAYGGGGVFLSMPLLEQLYDNFEECNSTGIEGGDKRVADCIYAHTMTKLSWEPGLHQTDIHGDASGFYEAARAQPLSIHHWKSWNEVDVVSLSAVASVCGAQCLLQRYRFEDGWTLVNGFSIFKYSDEYEAEEFDMEQTWWDGGDYGHSLAPLRPKDDGKVSYRLEASVVNEGEVRQYYVRRRDSGDGVIEVIWRQK